MKRFLPVAAPGALGIVFLIAGQGLRGVVLLAIAVAVLVLVLVGVRVDRAVMKASEAVASTVSVLATSLVGIGFVAVGGVARLAGGDPLRGGWRRRRRTGWSNATSDSSAALAVRPFATAGAVAGGPARSPVGRVGRATVASVGVLVVALAADLGAGLLWEAIDPPGAAIADRIHFTNDSKVTADPRVDLPAMAAYPWRKKAFAEYQMTQTSYWPFTESRPREFHGTYVNIDGWDRRTYRTAGVEAGDVPIIWMFGGSTTWGEGQRDGYTIASYIARIAESSRTPVIVRNFGQRGWTHFQEMILFEQLLHSEPHPDLAIFYDGANEINAQSLSAKGVPTHTLVDDYAKKLSGGVAPEFRDSSTPGNALEDTWTSYVQHSAVRRLVRLVVDGAAPSAGAETTAASARPVLRTDYDTSLEDARHAVDVYERGRSITKFLATSHNVQPIFFWQPVLAGPAATWANARVASPTVNISGALDDHPEVFIDGGHTNERGADLVARRIWRELKPRVARWYRDHPDEASRAASHATTSTTSSTPSTTSTTTPPSNGAAIVEAFASFEAGHTTPCQLVAFGRAAEKIRASTPNELESLIRLEQQYLSAIADATPSNLVSDGAAVRELAANLPAFARLVRLNPAEPFVRQLGTALNPTVIQSIQTVLDALDVECGPGSDPAATSRN